MLTDVGICAEHPFFLEKLASQVAAQPDAIAASNPAMSVSYLALWEGAAAIASGLVELGVRPGHVVGVDLGSGVHRAVATVGVLRLGAVACLLDPASPAGRRRDLTHRSGLRVVIGDRAGTGETDTVQRVRVADLLAKPARHEISTAVVHRGSAAFLVFTSGSSGTPKAITLSHEAFAGYLDGVSSRYEVNPRDVVLQFVSPEFDASLEETAVTLTSGARLLDKPGEPLASARNLFDYCRRHQVTVLDLPTSYWHHVVADADRYRIPSPPSLRMVIIGGEQARADRLRQWGAIAPGVELVNSYGPSETTIVVTTAVLDPQDTAATPSIGTALAPVTTELLALEDGREGEGELCVGGPTVSSGYWAAAAATAAGFRPDPHSTSLGGRTYRTGDRVRRDADGALTYLGRLDEQLKIAGHRVDPTDVEAVLRGLPQVSDVAVVPVRDAVGATVRTLAAFLVLEERADLGATSRLRLAEVTDRLAEQLPPAARPTLFRVMDSLPVGLTGKVRRRTLDPDRDGRPFETGIGYVEPRDDIERALCETLREVLDVPRVGLYDTFLTLGGASLTSMRTVTRLREVHGLELPLSALLSGATVADLAALHTSRRALSPEPEADDRPASDSGAAAPLSLPQERVWFLTDLEPNNPAYQFQMSVRLRGPLEAEVLHAALTAVVGRHEILRTTFELVDGEPRQVVHPPGPAAMRLVDADALVVAGGVDAVVKDECANGFSLDRLPLIRWTLIECGPQDHLLVHLEHHMIHDGWSLTTLLRDLESAYRALADGHEPRWDTPAPSYVEYAREQRAWLRSPEAATQREAWRRTLAGCPPVTTLPTDRPRSNQQTFRGDVVKRNVPADLARRLRRTAAERDTTAFSVMMGAFAVLLYRSTGQRDLCLGTSVANRDVGRWQDMLGMLVNNVVLRLELDSDRTVGDVVSQVRESMFHALDHQSVPFESVVEAVAPDRDLSMNPLFQAMFSFHDSPIDEVCLGSVRGRVGYLTNQTAKFDVNVVVIPEPSTLVDGPGDGAMVMEWEYNSDLFDRETIKVSVDAYLHILDALTGDAATPLRRITTLSSTAREELLAVGGRGRTDSAAELAEPEADLWAAVAAQARRRPDAVALRGPDGQETYGALRTRAEAIARGLAARGVGPDDVVAVAAGRTAATVAALLGVYRAGAAFLLLDEELPAERQRTLIEDSGAAIVLAVDPGSVPLQEGAGHHEVVALHEVVDPGDGLVADRAIDANLAYLIYTSGSTGRPKGVMVERGGLANYLRWCAREYRLAPGQRVPVHTALSVDMTLTSLLAPLTAGACVELLPGGYAGLDAIGEVVRGGEADLIKLTPTHLRALAAQRVAPADRPVTLVVGGEALMDRDLLGWPEGTRVVNEYGPTEAVVGCVVADVGTRAGTTGVALPIGMPMDHVRAYVSADGGLPHRGALGELLIGGQAPARGYRGAPRTTARMFRPDPFADFAGARVYATGDRVRWTTHDGLEYLGRQDRQLKVRGNRVDPAEIEHTLSGLRGGRPTAVVLRGEGLEQRLVAYLEGPPSEDLDVLRRSLAARLPAHMVPEAFVVLDGLPVTTGGKVDHDRLPAPREESAVPRPGQVGSAHAALSTDSEALVAQVWSDVLNVDEVRADSDFFALGGHSLLAVRVVVRLRDLGHHHVGIRDVFEGRTVRRIAARLDAAPGAEPHRAHDVAASRSGASVSRPQVDYTGLDGEELVAAVWRDVLNVDNVGADSDFFALGGHSLTAVLVLARLRARGYGGIRIHDVFESRTVVELARRLRTVESDGQEPRPAPPPSRRASDGLSDDEVERRLAELLTRRGTR